MRSLSLIAETVGSSLEELSLIGCSQFEPHAIEQLVQNCPRLRRLELYRVTQDYLLVERLLLSSPFLDLGYFYLLYCAGTGHQPVSREDREAARRIWEHRGQEQARAAELRQQATGARFRRWSIFSGRSDAAERGLAQPLNQSFET